MMSCKLVLCLVIVLSVIYKISCVCSKIPEGVVKLKDRNVGGKYFLEIPGNPKTYTPHQRYTVYLRSNPMELKQRRFKNFMISLEPDEDNNEGHLLGQLGFVHGTEMLARFSENCPNTVVESNTVPKTEVEIYWVAPPTGSGCINIKATVVESKEDWFSEDDSLTKHLCEDTLLDENIAPKILETCCACDEAKYELAFEGKWTRNTHPRHFPIDQWVTRFSDLIGSSHQYNHTFWRYGDFASDGLTVLANTGDTNALESELKNDSENIRTIIKARGLHYPNITRSTYAVFRVDSKNHLMSMVTKIIPSPDWIVGVSNFELCKEDCTWMDSRAMNLYLWDAGTNDGLRYESSIPATYKQQIRRLTPNSPNDPESPFYSKGGDDMKPIARLHLIRQRLYPKTCETTTEEETDCSDDEWSDWSPCSASCGEGVTYRKRASLDEAQATECNLNFIDYKGCKVEYCPGEEETESTTEDGDQTEETPVTEDVVEPVPLHCEEEGGNCEEDPKCPGSFWGAWSNCSVTCGTGVQIRLRIRKQEMSEEESSTDCPDRDQKSCVVPCTGDEDSVDKIGNNLEASSQIVEQRPDGEVINCKLTRWSRWSTCLLKNKDATCGKGYKYKYRSIKIHALNGGKECSKKLIKIENCTISCTSSGMPELTEDEPQCTMSPWSPWTPCSSSCGSDAVQLRTRDIRYQPPGVRKCPPREEKKACRLPLACTGDEIGRK